MLPEVLIDTAITFILNKTTSYGGVEYFIKDLRMGNTHSNGEFPRQIKML